MLKVLKYHLLSGTKKIGFFEMTEDKKNCRITLNKDLNWIDIPFDFEVKYKQGIFVYETIEVMNWIKSRVVHYTRQNINSILAYHNLDEYNEMDLFLVNNGRFCDDDFSISLIEGK